MFVPLDLEAVDGRQIAVQGRIGHLLKSRTPRPGHRLSTALLGCGSVEERHLPISPAGGRAGFVDDAVREALRARVHYS